LHGSIAGGQHYPDVEPELLNLFRVPKLRGKGETTCVSNILKTFFRVLYPLKRGD
jgi:hypothetical protein